jgi:hypothetical protein
MDISLVIAVTEAPGARTTIWEVGFTAGPAATAAVPGTAPSETKPKEITTKHSEMARRMSIPRVSKHEPPKARNPVRAELQDTGELPGSA